MARIRASPEPSPEAGAWRGRASAAVLALLIARGCGARSSLDVSPGQRERGGSGAASHEGGGGGGGGGGIPGQGGAGGATLPPGCWAELPGPMLVRVELSDRAFCMDATEVTNGHYAAWLETGPDPAAQPASCGWNESFAPWEQVWPVPPDHMDHPVAGVDHCDAEAYCRFAGKRLCRAGAEAGATEEWEAACTRGGEQAFPYGDTFSRTPAMASSSASVAPCPSSRCLRARAAMLACSISSGT